jgi:hypothetical protein
LRSSSVSTQVPFQKIVAHPRIPARGTSEPNFEAGGGKFGVIVGDPVVSNTTAALPGARGYPVQVLPSTRTYYGNYQLLTKSAHSIQPAQPSSVASVAALVTLCPGFELNPQPAQIRPSLWSATRRVRLSCMPLQTTSRPASIPRSSHSSCLAMERYVSARVGRGSPPG